MPAQGFTLTVNAGGSSSSNFAYVSGSVTGALSDSSEFRHAINPASSESRGWASFDLRSDLAIVNRDSFDERPE